jgi:putative membrane protein
LTPELFAADAPPRARSCRRNTPAYVPRNHFQRYEAVMTDHRRLSILLLASSLLAPIGCSHNENTEPPGAQAAQPDQTSGAERQTEAPTAPPIEEPAEPTTNPTPSTAERAEMPAQPATSPLDDNQIVRVVSTVDSGEIEQGQLAQQKASDVRVKKFAQQMIDQHSKSKQKNLTLIKQQQLLPSNSSVANDLTDNGSRVLDSLNRVEGPDFDKTYIDAQVDQHQAVLDLLNSRLIPDATNAELRSQLEQTKKMVEQHLQHAKSIQSQSQR